VSRRHNARRLDGHARRGRVAELGGRDGWACHYCGIGLAPGRRSTTIDEVRPLVRGGHPSADNQVLACSPCNQRKADMTAEEFAHVLARGGPPASYFAWRRELKQRQRRLAVTPGS